MEFSNKKTNKEIVEIPKSVMIVVGEKEKKTTQIRKKKIIRQKMSIQTINLLLVVVEQMRIIHLSTRSVIYSDPGMRYVARLHDRYLGKKKIRQKKESV